IVRPCSASAISPWIADAERVSVIGKIMWLASYPREREIPSSEPFLHTLRTAQEEILHQQARRAGVHAPWLGRPPAPASGTGESLQAVEMQGSSFPSWCHSKADGTSPEFPIRSAEKPQETAIVGFL